MIQNIWGKLATLNQQGVLDTLVGMGGFPYYVSPSGNDAGDGSFGNPKLTLAAAYSLLRTGKNDFIVVMTDPTSTSTTTLRLDAAFNWNKAATHLIGACTPMLFGQRARIAPTPTTTAFANFFTVSANGCIFQNIEFYHGFNTGTTAAICMTVTSEHNWFKNCQIAGMLDAASAADAGSRHLKIGLAGSGENLFEDCVIGQDTISRGSGSAANAGLELAGGTPRNQFRRCIFPVYTSYGGVLTILGTGADCVDRFNEFRDCTFENAIKSGSTQMTVLGSFSNAAPGGAIIFSGWCFSIGATKLGDTNMLANSYVCGPAYNSASFLANVPA